MKSAAATDQLAASGGGARGGLRRVAGRLQQINWRQVVVALVVGYAVSQGVPPDKAAEVISALVNMLAPVAAP